MKETVIEKINALVVSKSPFFLMVDFDMKNPLLYTPEQAAEEGVFFIMPSGSNTPPPQKQERDFVFQKSPVDYQKYCLGFNNVMKHINNGDTFLLNLTMPTKVSTDITLEEVFSRSNAPYRLLFKDKFVCFSPERFIKIQGREISSNPMKGTIDASIPAARQLILNDEKETAEHNTIVDLIRNDLSMVAGGVHVSRYRYFDEITTNQKTLLQVSSEIKGTLPEDYPEHLGEILFRLLPAGSISGAPKEKTVEVIHNSELDNRGYYTGVFFHFDGKNLDSAVMIRFLEKNDKGMTYRSGGGITFKSDPESEYQEMIDKVYVPFT